jgi:hypothetical protein
VDLQEARIERIDVDGVLGFAAHLVNNLGRMWIEANLAPRQKIHTAIVPEGLPFDDRGFGTAPTCFAFIQLRSSDNVQIDFASLSGASKQCMEISGQIVA